MSVVYVIDLKNVPFVNGETFNGVYVGVTSKNPQIRFKEHKKGISRSSRVVRYYGKGISAIYEVPKNRKGKEYEQYIANKFVKSGYYVWSGADAYDYVYSCSKCEKSVYLAISHKKFRHVTLRCFTRKCLNKADDVPLLKKVLKKER